MNSRIRRFVNGKTAVLNNLAEEQDKLKDNKNDLFEKEKEDINKKKEDDEKETTKMHQLIQQEIDERNKRDKEEQERVEEVERRKKEKLDMEDAARYIQRKWKWFQDVGKNWAKKRKGKKGGKKKGKKWPNYINYSCAVDW